jgi:hypothetical protein
MASIRFALRRAVQRIGKDVGGSRGGIGLSPSCGALMISSAVCCIRRTVLAASETAMSPLSTAAISSGEPCLNTAAAF